jgi:uncharacterized protein YqgV (UPF0045/DUF77 family)
MISCQFSLYPLGVADLGPAIDAAVKTAEAPGLEIEVGPMSSTMLGEAQDVFAALRRAFEVVAADGHVVMTVTVSNACPV